jgi:hypothetical protein
MRCVLGKSFVLATISVAFIAPVFKGLRVRQGEIGVVSR